MLEAVILPGKKVYHRLAGVVPWTLGWDVTGCGVRSAANTEHLTLRAAAARRGLRPCRRRGCFGLEPKKRRRK